MFSRKKSVLLFLLPGLLMILVFYIIPFAGGVAYSMTGRIYNPEMGVTQTKFVALNNYEKLWKNQMFQLGLKNTLELSALCTPILWLLSLVLSVFLEESIDSSSFFRSSTLLPYLLPSSAMLLIWLVAFDYGGPINRINGILGFDRVMWLESAALRTPIILMFIWKNLGFCIIIFSAALQAIPQSLYEYAILEGAGFITRVFRITLPLITPSAFLIFVLAWVNAFKVFKEVYFIGGAYPDYSVYTLQNYMNNMFSKLDYQNVTAVAYTFAFIVAIMFACLFLIQRRISDGQN
ncbi:MAG: carbohydrate ABC transporter permease [Faecousia sp.]